MKFAYLSHGNIPSQWAHTVQSMKMAEAFAGQIEDFTLVTGTSWRSLMHTRFDFESWYGIRNPFKITRLPVRGFPNTRVHEHVFSESFSKKAVAWAKRQGADLIYTRTPLAIPYCVDSGIPFVFESHHIQNDDRMEILKKHAQADNLKAIITITDYVRDTLIDHGVPESKLFVFPDAVDLSQFESPSHDVFVRPKGTFVVGYCGHLYDNRGIEEIIFSAKQLPHIHFVLAGGWEADVLRWRKATEALENVEFLGHLDHAKVPSFLTACDSLVMPYSASCPTALGMSPMKMFEYMATKKPVIATELPSVRIVLRDKENSLLVRPDDGAALASTILALSENPALQRILGAQARKDVSQFTWNARANAILSFISAQCGESQTSAEEREHANSHTWPNLPLTAE